MAIATRMLLAACNAGGGSSAAALNPVRLQLQWLPQEQFCGYYAALDQGYYKDQGLDVTILPGAVDIVPATVVAAGNAEFGISWLPKALASRENGADIQFIGQPFQRSPTLQIAFKDKASRSPRTGRARRSAAGALATRPSCTPPSARPASIPTTRPT
jgi:NitT/TauT family transport system substrate-binding protein